jgi:Ser/Thr protein kinase RdoA (MazF antagonist)
VPWDMILTAFDIGSTTGEPQPVGGGWVNRVWRAETSRGVFAVKEMSDSRESWWLDQFRRGAALERAACESKAVPMAEPIPAFGGDNWLAALTTSDGTVRRFRCHRWVYGEPCLNRLVEPAKAKSVGSSVAAITNLRLAAGSSSDGLPFAALDAFDATVEEALTTKKSWAGHLQALTPRVHELREPVLRLQALAVPLLLCHRDIDPKNATRRPDGQVSIQDWDHGGPMLPDAELLGVALSFAGGPERADIGRVRSCLDGYREAAGPQCSFEHAATPLIEASFSWLMFNAWLVLGHRAVAITQRRQAASLLPKLIASWPRESAAMDRWASLLGDQTV